MLSCRRLMQISPSLGFFEPLEAFLELLRLDLVEQLQADVAAEFLVVGAVHLGHAPLPVRPLSSNRFSTTDPLEPLLAERRHLTFFCRTESLNRPTDHPLRGMRNTVVFSVKQKPGESALGRDQSRIVTLCVRSDSAPHAVIRHCIWQ